jgi:hypothetical protein
MNRALDLLLLLLVSVCSAAEPLWSLKPVAPAPVPASAGKTPIDRFLLAKLEASKLGFSPPADPRTQVRRLYFDLIGLPPPPEVVEAFVKDPSDAAYSKLVDDLLASPHYGERWARHWLDLVRYGESDGFERNAPRPSAWKYRDWVIQALNEDMPYDRFARLQIAGDVLEPESVSGVKATGFLVAGIHNTVLGSNKIANDTARQDELEDIIATVGQTFLGASVQCARCHDHKFDPITQVDYYRLAAALGGVFHGEQSLAARPDAARAKIESRLVQFDRQLASQLTLARNRLKIDGPVLTVKPVARWSFDDEAEPLGGLTVSLENGARIEKGRLILDGKAAVAVTQPLKRELSAKTLEAWAHLATLDQRGGGVMTIETPSGAVFDSIVYAEQEPRRWMPGSEFYRRTRKLHGPEETDGKGLVHMAITYSVEGKITAYRNGQQYGESYVVEKPTVFPAGEARVLFGQRHTGGGNAFLAAEVEEARLYDRALTAEEIRSSYTAGPGANAVPLEKLLSTLSATELAERKSWLQESEKLRADLKPLVAEKVFAVVSKLPEPTHVLNRGDVRRPREAVTAGGVAAIPGTPDFQLPMNAREADRRAGLAKWIARRDNPLFTRVIVNRLWQQHFGTGIVDTPSDFGNNGGKPSHPELLDYLAAELVRHDFHLKPLHRLIVTSEAYRQGSRFDAAAAKIDADNRLLWRKSPVRLEAESLRDAMLQAAGKLNTKAGGPGFQDVRIYENSGTTFYEPIDRPGPEFDRRTIYRFSPRGERSALLETFDCPDPSAQTPRRQVTTTPLQALALWNDALVLRLSADLADRAQREADTPRGRIERMFQLTLARKPTDEEARSAADLGAKHGLAALGRVLFNCNEFVVID